MSYSTEPLGGGVWLQIGSVVMNTPAWQVLNPMVLYQGPRARGKDRVIPGASGVRPGKRRPSVTQRSLEMLIRGDRAWDGSRHANEAIGLELNITHLRENLTDPDDGGGTRVAQTATLTLPSGSTVAGSLHIESFELDYWDTDALAVLDVTLTAGRLT